MEIEKILGIKPGHHDEAILWRIKRRLWQEDDFEISALWHLLITGSNPIDSKLPKFFEKKIIFLHLLKLWLPQGNLLPYFFLKSQKLSKSHRGDLFNLPYTFID